MAVSAFCNQLVRFFEELTVTFPDERDIKSGLEVIQGARKINPRMVWICSMSMSPRTSPPPS